MAPPARSQPAATASVDAAIAPQPKGDFDPIQLLRSIESGDVAITLPANAGDYGKGMNGFTVRPGTTITIHAKVRDGALVPGITRIEFEPKLDNFAWIETTAFELTADGQILARLDGFPDMTITNDILALNKMQPPLKRLPLDMPSLYDTIQKGSKIMAEQAKEFTSGAGPLFDPDRIDMRLTNCVLAPGPLSLPDPSIKAVVGGTPPPKHQFAPKIHDAIERGDWATARKELERTLAAAAKGEIRPPEVKTLVEETLPHAIAKAEAAGKFSVLEIIGMILLALTGVGLLIDAGILISHFTNNRAHTVKETKALLEKAKTLKSAPESTDGRTVVEMTAKGNSMHIEGKFELKSLGLDRPEAKVKAGATTVKRGVIDVGLETVGPERIKKPTSVSVQLDGVSFQADSIAIDDGKGTAVNLGASRVEGGNINLGYDVKKGAATGVPTVHFDSVDAEIASSRFVIPTTKGTTTLFVDKGHVKKGVLDMGAGGLTAQLDEADVTLHTDGMEAGDGAFRIGYSNAQVAGTGSLSYRNGEASFRGDMTLDGTVADARLGVPGGMFSADVATGAKVKVRLNELDFGRAGVDFKGNGQLDVTLDSGEILLTTGTRLKVGRGTKAKVTIDEVAHDQAGTSFKGKIELDANVGADIDPALLSGPGVSVTKVKGVDGRVHIVLEHVEMQKNGDLSITGMQSEAHVTVTRIEGKLDKKLLTTATPRSAPTITATLPAPMKAMRTASTVSAPNPMDVVNAIDGGMVVIKVPVPKSEYVRAGTVATITVNASGGEVDFKSARISFSPSLDLPGPFGGNGLYFNDDGDIIADISNFPDINISAALDLFGSGRPRLPKKISSIFALATALSGGSGGAGGSSSIGLDTLASYGIEASFANVSLNGNKIGLGGGSFVTIDPSSRLAMTFDSVGGHGRASIAAGVKLQDATITTSDAMVEGLKGSATLAVRVVGDGSSRTVDASVSGALTAKKTVVARPDAYLEVSDASLNGTITLSQAGSGKPHMRAALSSVSGTLAPSQVLVSKNGSVVPVELTRGAFNGSLVADDAKGTLALKASVKSGAITAPTSDLGMDGFSFQVDKVTANVDGDIAVDIDPAKKASSVHVKGDVRVSAAINSGGFGSAKTPFAFTLGKGSSAALALNELEFGTPASNDTVMVGGATLGDKTPAAQIDIVMQGGHMVLPNGMSLNIVSGTKAKLSLSRVQRKAGDTFASASGSMTLRAYTATRVPPGGLQIADGVRLKEIKGSQGQVEITIDNFTLNPDGTFSLSGTQLNANVHVDQLGANVDLKKLLNDR